MLPIQLRHMTCHLSIHFAIISPLFDDLRAVRNDSLTFFSCSLPSYSDFFCQRGTVKVDLARKQGGIKIVWLSWFTDSIALWRRQDETPYLLDEPPAPPAPAVSKQDSASPSADVITSSDIDFEDSEDWDQEPEMPMKGPPGRLELESIDWGDINAEVEAAMNESDDDDSWSMHDGMISEGDDLVDDTNSATGFVTFISLYITQSDPCFA